MNNLSESNLAVVYEDDVPTVQQQVIIPKLEYERLKRIVREGESSRIKSRNRMFAVFVAILVFVAASSYVILGG